MSNRLSIHNRPLAKPKPLPAALKKKISAVSNPQAQIQPATNPSETFTPSTPIARKAPRPGSDMDIMVGDLEKSGAISPRKTERPKPREGSDMAQMLADIDKQKNSFHQAKAHVTEQGTIAMLEEPIMPAPLNSGKSAEAKRSSKNAQDDRTDDVMSTGGVAIEGVEHAGNSAAAGLGEVAGDAIEQGTQIAGKTLSSQGLETALFASSGLSGLLALPLALRGVAKFKQGRKENDLDKKLEGANGVAVGMRSAATSVTLSSMATGSTSTLSNVASVAAPWLGVGTAAVDGIIGTREILSGKDKVGGVLRVGFAAGVGAAALGAGPIATIAAGGFLVARVGRGVYKAVKGKGSDKTGQPTPSQTKEAT